MIERDDFQGPPSSANPPRQKKLYLFDLNEIDRRLKDLRVELCTSSIRIEAKAAIKARKAALTRTTRILLSRILRPAVCLTKNSDILQVCGQRRADSDRNDVSDRTHKRAVE